MGRVLPILFLIQIALWVAALISCLSTEEGNIRALPRIVWVIIILLFPLVGSIAWFVVGSHVLLHAIDLSDTVGLTAVSVKGPWQEKHFVNTTDNSNYWYFMVLSWVPLYALVFLGPRFF